VAHTTAPASYKSLLHQMTQTTATCLWNDSAAIDELTRSIADGAVGATCNPVIALAVVKADLATWTPRHRARIDELPAATENQIAGKVVEELSIRAAALLEPAFQADRGRNGRLSIQTDPQLFRDTAALIAQAEHFHQLAANMIVKIPATRAGIAAIEECTYRGISINATVSFTLAQCIAVAEAVERGLSRREREGKDIATMGPVCTLMVGRLDDWLKVVADREAITVEPGALEWAGVAVFKKAYQLYRARGYRLRLLSAAFRNHLHWSELVGGDVVISPPYAWQARLNQSGVAVAPRIDQPVAPHIVGQLHGRFGDFRRAYDQDALPIAEFDSFAPTRRTLRQFLAASRELDAVIRDIMVPDPDK